MTEVFVDRQDYTESLSKLMRNCNHSSFVYILAARSGYGKTSFFRNFLSDSLSEDWICHSVIIPDQVDKSFEAGGILRRTAEVISEDSNACGYLPFGGFIRGTNNPIVKRIYEDKLAQTTSPWFKMGESINSILHQHSREKTVETYQIINPIDEKLNNLLVKEYLKEALYGRKNVIRISNAQNLDSTSTDGIVDVMKAVSSVVFLLEYTLDDDGSMESAQKLGEYFEEYGITNHVRRLEKLEKRYTKDVFDSLHMGENIELSEKQFDDVFVKIDGNLRQLTDVETVFVISGQENYTEARMEKLNDTNAKHLLCIVATDRGEVSKATLDEMAANQAFPLSLCLEETLSALGGNHPFLLHDKDNYYIAHDSVTRLVLQMDHFIPARTQAYQWWIEYYESKVRNEKCFENIRSLCYFYSVYEPCYVSIPSLFPDIRIMARNSANPSNTLSFLSSIADSAEQVEKKSLANDIRYFLMDLYYELGFYDEALSLLDDVEFEQNEVHYIYTAMLYNRTKKYSNALSLLDEKVHIYPQNDHFRLCAGIIRLLCYASMNQHTQSEKLFYELLEDNSFRTYKEYGYLLRSSVLSCSLDETICFLKKSIEFFRGIGETEAAGHSEISLMMTYCRSGQTDKARVCLQNAKDHLDNNSMVSLILINNEVAMRFCDKEFDMSCESSLQLAMSLTDYTFDKIVIGRNMLLLYIENQEYKKAEDIANYLLKLVEQEPNELCVCNTYLQISYFHKSTGSSLFDTYYQKYTSLYNELENRGLRKCIRESAKICRPNNEYTIGFLSFWSYPIPRSLIDD